MKTVLPLWLRAFQRRVSGVRPKMRKLHGEEHFRSTSEMGLRSECGMWKVSLDFDA